MPDRRQHRGPHPEDERLFHSGSAADLASATHDLSWLLSRGYNEDSALALVGDRYRLRKRQRKAVSRSACSDHARARRQELRRSSADLQGQELAIDGFNTLITLESWLGGAVLLRGRDGAVRDMASVHGSYRRVEETVAAMALVFFAVRELRVGNVQCLFDRPVSNSGRAAALFRELAGECNVPAEAECVDDPDRQLTESAGIVCSSDRWVLDRCAWFDLPGWLLQRRHVLSVSEIGAVPEPWLIDMTAT